MKLSQLIEKFGDIEVDVEKLEENLPKYPSLEEIELELKSLSTELFVKITKELKTNGKIKISEKYDTTLIMDTLYNIHIIDGYNEYYKEIKNAHALLADLIYYITDSDYGYDDVDIKNIAELIHEEKDLCVISQIKQYCEDLLCK